MKNTMSGRSRVAAFVAVSIAVVGGTAATTTAPAQSAPGDACLPAFPIAGLPGLPDDTVFSGLTVSEGTTPEPFTGDYIGIIEDGIAPGLDMVMMELSSDALTQAGGIWQGMSGSPVYTPDGDLVGAVAYGLSFGPSPIAGITPFEEMDDYLPAPAAGRVAVPHATARKIAAATDVTAAQAAEGFRQIRMPMGVSGVTGRRMDGLVDRPRYQKRSYLPKSTYPMGAAAAPGEGAGPETIVPGGNLAAAASYGVVTQGGVGTVTSVCDDGVVGFGHPASFLGNTSMTMHPAEAVYVQPDSMGAPFKVANLGAPAGTIDGDHMSGISGTLGATPELTDVSSTVSFQDRSRNGTSHVSILDAAASTTFLTSIAMHDRVIDGITGGSELLTASIAGTTAAGRPFDIQLTDRYATTSDITFEAPWEIADLVWYLSMLQSITIEDVSMDSAVDEDSSTWRVGAIEQKRDGRWVKVGKGKQVIAQAGKTLKVRAVLTGAGGAVTRVPLSFNVPKKASGRRAHLSVVGGAWTWSEGSVGSVAAIEKMVAGMTRNDAVEGNLFIDSGRRGLERRDVSAPTAKVVHGQKGVPVRVR